MNKTSNKYHWYALSIIFLGTGGAFAFIMGMSRAPKVSEFFPSDYFHVALTAHVVFAILFWLLSFTIVIWKHFFDTADTLKKDYSHYFAIFGSLLILFSVLTARGPAAVNNYVPTLMEPVYYTGLILIFTAIIINAVKYLKLAIEKLFSDEALYSTLSTSVIVAKLMIVSMICAFFITKETPGTATYFEELFWYPGHIQQFLNGTVLVTLWHFFRRNITGETINSKFLNKVNFIFIISALILLVLEFSVDALTRNGRIFTEIIYAIGLGLPIFIHIVFILKGTKVNFKQLNYTVMVISMIIYLLGVFIAYTGLGPDLRVPAHYHGTVTSLTLAMMGFSYFLLKEFTNKILFDKIAKLQPLLYGSGMFFFIIGLFIAGSFGAPRKTHGTDFVRHPLEMVGLGISGIGTLVAVVAGIIFVYYTAATLIKETKK